jgi:hypothetical protein
MVVVLAAVAGALLTALAMSTPEAAAQDAGRIERPVVAVTGQLTAGTYGLFLVDSERDTLVVYEIVPQGRDGRVLQLRAARTMVFDTQLEAYNTTPDPAEIAEMVQQARRIGQ